MEKRRTDANHFTAGPDCSHRHWLLEKHQAEDRQHVRDILDKARSLSRLSLEDVAGLMVVHSQDLLDELFHTAKSVKEEIYGNRIVLFAPLYISNLCSNGVPVLRIPTIQ